jgi:uncharacterized protein (DUF1800 family)
MDEEVWLEAEIAKPATQYLAPLLARQNSGENIDAYKHQPMFWDNMILADDQLRTRMVFALSQLFVISDADMYGQTPQVGYFMDVLSRNAFGNFRDLLEDVTYSSAMARYLTYWRNEKGDPDTGRMPDENYAREVMQLFTIGVNELNPDGTPKLVNGKEVEIFDNSDVEGLAKVFTGLSWKGSSFYSADPDGMYKRLEMFDTLHSREPKSFLGTTIPANTGGDESIKRALDTIFAHPNVGPFVSRQLIQRLTASSPSPEYVGRVSAAFDAGTYVAKNGTVFGTGERGDLEATVAAILLDASLHDANSATDVQRGKIREPVLKFVHWARAFEITDVDSSREELLNDTSNPATRLAQQPFRSPSVFNFYRPGFISPGSETGAQGLTAPEFQLVHEGSVIGYMNMMTKYILDVSGASGSGPNFVPDYRDEITLANDPTALVDRLDLLLTGDTMTDALRADIIAAVGTIPIGSGTADMDRLRRVQLAVFMTISSPAYAIQR